MDVVDMVAAETMGMEVAAALVECAEMEWHLPMGRVLTHTWGGFAMMVDESGDQELLRRSFALRASVEESGDQELAKDSTLLKGYC